MTVNACQENYSWLNDQVTRDGGHQTNSNIVINLPGLYQVVFGLIFPATWFSSSGKNQPQVRLVVNG